MASTKEKMQQARQLIQEKRYDEARAILRTIDHDKAYEWLDKINAMQPAAKSSVPITTQAEVAIKAKNDENAVPTRLVCPKCEAQTLYPLSTTHMTRQGHQSFQCAECGTDFTSRIVSIRAKKSRGDKKSGRRTFEIRVVNLDGSEDLIQFGNQSYDDIELRSKDAAAFSYMEGKLKIVQNLTIGQYWKIHEGCYLATYVYGQDSSQVRTLRHFRDSALLSSSIGVALVKFYYILSPKLILHFGRSPLFRRLVTMILYPVVSIVDMCTSEKFDD